MKRNRNRLGILGMVGLLGILLSCNPKMVEPQEPSLTKICEIIRHKTFVDLTHDFEPGIPHWPGFPDEKRETIYGYETVPAFRRE